MPNEIQKFADWFCRPWTASGIAREKRQTKLLSAWSLHRNNAQKFWLLSAWNKMVFGYGPPPFLLSRFASSCNFFIFLSIGLLRCFDGFRVEASDYGKWLKPRAPVAPRIDATFFIKKNAGWNVKYWKAALETRPKWVPQRWRQQKNLEFWQKQCRSPVAAEEKKICSYYVWRMTQNSEETRGLSSTLYGNTLLWQSSNGKI